MPSSERRFKFIRLFIAEQVGDINSRNLLGYKPAEIDHSLSINDIPADVREHFKELNILSQEADYMIITS